jgi:hypothetical protein
MFYKLKINPLLAMKKCVKLTLLLACLFTGCIAFAQTTKDSTSGSRHKFHSAIPKGSVVLTGSVGYTSTGTSATINFNSYTNKGDSVPVPNTTAYTTTFVVNAGYFIADNLAIGISLNYSNTVSPANALAYNNIYYSYNNVSTTWQAGLIATRYFYIGRNFYFTGNLNLSYIATTITDYTLWNVRPTAPQVVNNPVEQATGYNILLTPGLAYFPVRRLQLFSGSTM